MKTNYIYKTLVMLIAIFSLFSCQKNEDSIDSVLTDVDLSVFVANIAHTRAAPPDGGSDGGTDIIGESKVDRVRVVTFRRAKNSGQAFTYDISNDITLLCNDEQGVRTARGKMKAEVGYEYQTLVFGYAVARGEESMFHFGTLADGITTMTDFKLNISHASVTAGSETAIQVASPELFYGYCHIGDDQRIFSGNGNKLSLEGVLFRCVGRVTISITDIPASELQQMTLFAETVNSQSNTLDYSDFKITQTPITPESWKLMSSYIFTEEGFITVSFEVFMLAVETRMKIRVRETMNDSYTDTDYILRYESVGDDSNATGIITPAANEEILYIRRNKQYNVSGGYGKLTGAQDI